MMWGLCACNSGIHRVRTLILLGCWLLLLPACLMAQSDAPPGWSASQQGSTRMLNWNGVVSLLDQQTRISLRFSADPTHTRELTGAVGFDLYLPDDVAALAPFNFDDFDGPDAPAAEHDWVQITVERKDQQDLVLHTSASGWTPDGNNFAFGVNALSYEKDSVPRNLLVALAAGAERVRISITDPQVTTRKLEFVLDVTGQQAAFAELLTDLR